MEQITEFEIRITGSGVREQVAKALFDVAKEISETPVHELVEGIEWEDPILFVETNTPYYGSED